MRDCHSVTKKAALTLGKGNHFATWKSAGEGGFARGRQFRRQEGPCNVHGCTIAGLMLFDMKWLTCLRVSAQQYMYNELPEGAAGESADAGNSAPMEAA